LTLRDVKIDAKRGLLVRNAEVATQAVTIKSADKTPFRPEVGGTSSRPQSRSRSSGVSALAARSSIGASSIPRAPTSWPFF
jgi:hypothetical protein